MDEARGPRRNAGRPRMRATTLALAGLVVVAVAALVIGALRWAAPRAAATAPYVAPADRPKPWLVKNPALAGKVLHWTQSQVVVFPGQGDPANGKLIIGDIWERLDASGNPNFSYSRWTYPDGTFHQEIYATTQEYIVIEGDDYRATAPQLPPGYPTPTNWCVTKQPSTPRLLADATPEFANEALLPAAAYTKSQGALDRTAPMTASLPGARALDVYPIPAVAHLWKHRFTYPSGNVTTTTIGVDARGRIVLWNSHYADAHGRAIGTDTWFAAGEMFVYGSPAVVPPSVLAVPPQVTKGCD